MTPLTRLGWIGLSVCLAVTAASADEATKNGDSADWPSIRGLHFDGSAGDRAGDLGSGSLSLKVAWKRPIGSGYSGVVKHGDLLATAMADLDESQEYVLALDATSGETLWQTATGPVFKGANGSFDGPIATPAIDGEHVYHLSPFGVLAAYDRSNGDVVWSKNLPEDFKAQPNFYGFGASPIVYDGKLIVVAGAEDGAVMAFDTASGDVAWKAGVDSVAFQSPVPVELDGQTRIIAAGNTTLFAIDPASGEVVWSKPHNGSAESPAWAIVPVPVAEDEIFLNDKQDGSTVVGIDGSGATESWSGREIRNTYCVPVMSGDVLCSYSSRFLVGVDPATGKRLWRTRSPENGFLATLDGRLVAATMNGSVHIGDVTRDGFEEVAVTQAFDATEDGADGLMWALPSVAGNSIYVRSLGAIARVDVSRGESATEELAGQNVISPGFAKLLDRVAAADDKQAVIDGFMNGKTTPYVDGPVVHFLLQGDYQDAAVASEIFGVRQERPMTRVEGTNLFYYGVEIPAATRASYVFFGDYEPIADENNPRRVVSTTLAGEMEPVFMGPADPLTFAWFDTNERDADSVQSVIDQPGELAGTLVTKTLDSAATNESVKLTVYLPPGYDDSGDAAYPVVVVHDGGVALESGHQAHALDALIQKGAVRPAVAVFVHKRFYVMQGAMGYSEMFAEELLPMLRREYRVSGDRNDMACLGGGFGGTLALISGLVHHDEVGRIGCHAPFLFEMLQPMVFGPAQAADPSCGVHIEWGEYEYRNPGENWDMASQAALVGETLRKAGHDVTAQQVSGGTDWVCWRARSETMWSFLVGK